MSGIFRDEHQGLGLGLPLSLSTNFFPLQQIAYFAFEYGHRKDQMRQGERATIFAFWLQGVARSDRHEFGVKCVSVGKKSTSVARTFCLISTAFK